MQRHAAKKYLHGEPVISAFHTFCIIAHVSSFVKQNQKGLTV